MHTIFEPYNLRINAFHFYHNVLALILTLKNEVYFTKKRLKKNKIIQQNRIKKDNNLRNHLTST
ncbi:hypothetical protein SAMN05444267_101235 [Chryseobacterium polytrichastri]|uniref:Uncharacterized protein n=1 Tax=Chryseobacterium polytrichastri TaxID=1302687 RepID=A0A1M6XZC9_9FLAO|nr:hypothetical protein SAMN05444267_101235 [Chryseobacterium polytrichastri]